MTSHFLKRVLGIDILFEIIDPLPIKTSEPIFTPPLIITPVDMWQLLPISTSCSIIAPVLIIQFTPIFTSVFINAFEKIHVPNPIFVFLETLALFDIITGVLNLYFFNFLNIFLLIFEECICPTPIIAMLIFFFLKKSNFFSTNNF